MPVRALSVEQEGDREVQQSITEEFETLIIPGGADGRVREGFPKQVGIMEPIAEAKL